MAQRRQMGVGQIEVGKLVLQGQPCVINRPLSHPQTLRTTPRQKIFPIGRGAEGLGMGLNFPWSLHAMKAGFRMGLVAVTASSVFLCFPVFIIISLPLAL